MLVRSKSLTKSLIRPVTHGIALSSGGRFKSTIVVEKKESYSEKQAKTGRPVSPHVTIYSFPITALSSITNRVTGVGLVIGKFIGNASSNISLNLIVLTSFSLLFHHSSTINSFL